MSSEDERGLYIEPSIAERWKPSNIEPLARVVPEELGITRNGIARFDRFMGGFGTSEAKMISLFSLLPAFPQSVQDIHKAITGSFTEDVWFPQEAGMRKAYLDDSLVPTGLAAQVREGWRIYYEATDEGEYPGKAIAAAMLFDAASHNRSWKDVLGSLVSPSNSRSHINRLSILFSLIKGFSHEAGIAEATDITDSVVGNNIRDLATCGLVDYDSITTTQTQGWVSYRLIGNLEEVLHQPTRNRLRRNIVGYFKNNEIGNAKTIAQAVERRDELDVINVLSELVAAGIVERTDYHGAVKQSDAKITSEGQALVDDVLIPTLQVCSGAQPSERMTVIQEEVETNPHIMTRAMQIFQQTASGFNKQSARETAENVLRFVREQGPARYKQIVSGIGLSAGKALRELTQRGNLTKYKEEKAVFYYIEGEQELPSIEKERIVYEYQPPDELVPLNERKKEEYHADMETPMFWQQLARDLDNLTDAVTESTFYRYYRPNSTDWMIRNDHKAGDYSNFVSALRQLAISEPYTYIREYIPTDNAARLEAEITQKLILEKLTSSLKQERYKEGLKQFESLEFWERFQHDLEAFEPGMSFRSFIVYFNHDNLRAAEFDGKRQRMQGDHRLLTTWFSSHYKSLRAQPELRGIPEQLTSNGRLTMNAYMYAKSPENVRQLLLEKFPDDFGDVIKMDFDLINSPDEEVKNQSEVRLLALISFAQSIVSRMKSVTMDPREIQQVEKLIQFGQQAKEHLAAKYQKIIQSIAGRFVNRGLEWHDIVQEGGMGLLNAMKNFDRTSSKKFVAYAIVSIRGHIQNQLKDARDVVKRRWAIHNLAPSVFRTRNELTQQYGREPTPQEIAQYLGAPEEDVIEVFQSSQVSSLQDLVGENEGTELGDLIEDTSAPDPAIVLEQQEIVVEEEKIHEALDKAIQRLSKREQLLIKLHFNLTGEGEQTLESLRKNWGMKRDEVRQFLDKTLEKLKRYIQKPVGKSSHSTSEDI